MPPALSAVERSTTTDVPQAVEPEARRHSYTQILKSSAMIGGSSVINIVVSVVRGKAMALLLGPAGIGVVGLFSAIFDLVRALAGLGVNSSGVRQIAEAVGSGDGQRIARTAAVLRRTSTFLGSLGAVGLIALSGPVSSWTFGSREFSGSVALLSIAVLLQLISDGQTALIQGTRRIADLARISVFVAVFGTATSVSLVYFLGERGVVPSLIGVAAITFVISRRYVPKSETPAVYLAPTQVRDEAKALLMLGTAFMASAVLTTGAAYAIRIIVRDSIGFDAAGLYQSAWMLGGMYVGFILQAMGSDFYPRLTGVATDHQECNRMVNEQAQISLLLAGPGVLATLTFAPIVIAILYSGKFAGAVEPLRWICLGMALRVIAWPMGYVVLAKGVRGIFFWTEVAATVVHVGLAFVLVQPFGLAGATMAFAGLYIWHSLLIYFIVHRLTGFEWSPENRRTIAWFLIVIGGVFAAFLMGPAWLATALGGSAVLASSVYSLRTICRLVSVDRLPRFARELLVLLKVSPELGSV
jgi:PST family polysaccharide transporter